MLDDEQFELKAAANIKMNCVKIFKQLNFVWGGCQKKKYENDSINYLWKFDNMALNKLLSVKLSFPLNFLIKKM